MFSPYAICKNRAEVITRNVAHANGQTMNDLFGNLKQYIVRNLANRIGASETRTTSSEFRIIQCDSPPSQ